MMAQCDAVNSTATEHPNGGAGVYVLAGAIFAISVLATIYFCYSMAGGMDMPGGWTMSMMWMRMPGQTWPESAGMFMLMWVAMMVAMMLPSSMPVILRYYHTRCSQSRRGAMAATGLMTSGYFSVWSVAGLLIYLPGVLWASAAMRWAALSRATPVLIGATLLIGGGFQFTPWKRFGLSRCRGPFSCAPSQPQGTIGSAWRHGMDCGICCVTCCFGPTLILLALGMMSPAVIVGVAVLIALEKLIPEPKYVVRLAGIAASVWGIALIGRLAR